MNSNLVCWRLFFCVLAISVLAVGCKQAKPKVEDKEPSADQDTSAEPGGERPSADTTLAAETPNPATQAGAAKALPIPEPEGPPSDERFKKWLDAVIGVESLYIDDWFLADLDGDGKSERVAELCRNGEDAWHESWWVVETQEGARFVAPYRSEAKAICKGFDPSRELPPFEQRPTDRIEMTDSGMGGAYSEQIVAMRDGMLVELRTAGSAGKRGDAVAREFVLDWDEGRFWYGELLDDAADDVKPVERLGALIPVERKADTTVLPGRRPAQNFVVFGKEARESDGDVSLHVTARALDEDTVRVRVMVEDDLKLALPASATDKDFVAADHVEIWWCTSADCLGEDGREHTRQLGIAADDAGNIVSRWLFPAGHTDPLPLVEGSPHAFELTLTTESLATEPRIRVMPPGAQAFPFTVAYSDSDDATAGQQTLVATSRLDWANAKSFGQLVMLPDFARYPATSQPMVKGQRVTPAPRNEDE